MSGNLVFKFRLFTDEIKGPEFGYSVHIKIKQTTDKNNNFIFNKVAIGSFYDSLVFNYTLFVSKWNSGFFKAITFDTNFEVFIYFRSVVSNFLSRNRLFGKLFQETLSYPKCKFSQIYTLFDASILLFETRIC